MKSNDKNRVQSPKPKPVPPAMKRDMQHAIALHRREHGNKQYDLIRERPEFAPWIGRGTGETGGKRFQRMVRKVARALPKNRTRPHESREINEAQLVWAVGEARHANDNSGLPAPLSAARVMSGGATALAG